MRKQLKWGLLLLVVLAAVACGRTEDALLGIEEELAAVEATAGDITPTECPLKITGETEGETYACGLYTAPVDYDRPAGETINLPYMILYASGEEPLPDPVVFLAGGPGQSGLVAAGDTLYGDLRVRRDLIFPAQRGTLFARRLGLEECVALLSQQMESGELNAFVDSVSSGNKPDATLPYDAYLAAYRENAGQINGRCHAAFAQAGLDPAQFTTANSTNDLAGLMEALGYGRYNLQGVSYGTRMALETLRRHPEADIRSVVLDSPAAPTTDRLATLASATHDVVLRLFDICAADGECNAAYPNLTQRTADLLAALAVEPLTVEGERIGPDEVLRQLRDLSNTRANYMPRMIAELESGDTVTYLALLSGEVGSDPPEGSVASRAVNDLIQQISLAGMQPTNPFAGLQIVTDVLDAANEDDPRAAMKAVVEEALADAENLPQILEGIDSLTADDLETLQGMMDAAAQPTDEAQADLRIQANGRNNAQFLLSGIVCAEKLPFEDIDAAVAGRENLAIPALATSGALLATEVGNCADYPMGEPDASYHAPVESNVPILILQGEFDVRTPLQNGLDLAQQLSNATLVVVPQAGHETWTSADGCVGQIGSSFIQNPDETPDLSCLEARQERFVLPDEALMPATES